MLRNTIANLQKERLALALYVNRKSCAHALHYCSQSRLIDARSWHVYNNHMHAAALTSNSSCLAYLDREWMCVRAANRSNNKHTRVALLFKAVTCTRAISVNERLAIKKTFQKQKRETVSNVYKLNIWLKHQAYTSK
jgi:hypothetical protein